MSDQDRLTFPNVELWEHATRVLPEPVFEAAKLEHRFRATCDLPPESAEVAGSIGDRARRSA